MAAGRTTPVRSTFALTLLLLGSSAAIAPAQNTPALSESVEVRVVSIDVVVTDSKGHKVSGLGPEDFELYEGQKQKPISNFSEIRVNDESAVPSGEATANSQSDSAQAPQGRRFIIFVDNASLHPFSRNRVLDSLRKFIATQLNPDDQVMLATWNHGLQVKSRFSGDRTVLNNAIASIGETTGGASSLYSMRGESERQIRNLVEQVREAIITPTDGYSTAMSVARAYGARLAGEERNMIAGLQGLMSTVAGRPEKKVLLFVGKSLPANPGAEMFQYADEQFGSFLPQGTNSITARMETSLITLQESLARTANSQGLTLYFIYADTGDVSPAELHNAPSALVDGLELSNNFTSFQRVARMTGGLALGNTSSFDSAFQQIGDDTSDWYSLGYHSDLTEGERKIRVKMKRSDLRVRARETLVSRSFDAGMGDRVIANLFGDIDERKLFVNVTFGTPVPQNRNTVKLPVHVRIPADQFTLLPGEKGLEGGFAVYFAVADDDGAISAVTKQGRTLRLNGTDPAMLKGEYYTFSTELLLRRKNSTVSVAVLDLISHEVGYNRSKVTLQ